MHPLAGHHDLRRKLSAALAADHLPQLLLLTGPTGVGKQRLALWLGQLSLCATPIAGEPCGTCPSCRMALELSHPDLHWFFPLPRPKAGESDKQMAELEEAQASALAERRTNPLYGRPDGMSGHFMATAQLVARRASLTPAVSRRKVIILGEAERLVPQAANPEAANALLKLFEEPPADTSIILTAHDLSAILPTIVSRAVPLRVTPLPDADVREFLKTNLSPTPAPTDLDARVARAGGAIGRAVDPSDDAARARTAADELLAAIRRGPGPRLERALAQGAFAARGDFTELLDALAERMLETARERLGHPAPVGGLPVAVERIDAAAAVGVLERIRLAREAAQGNVNPQLILASLSAELAGAL
ncbi:MAG TPA: DNA polymerase III subunit [Gemmatimonadales bacterium]|nr:DNA polymerase III subunit [Gemmatimonadales bacterium]